MRHCLLASIVLILVVSAVQPVSAQTAPAPQAGTAQTIPDLSGIWEARYTLTPNGQPRSDICGEGTCDEILGSELPGDTTVEEPQMLPWAEEKYKAAREGIPEGIPFGREEANPWFSACLPMGPTTLMLATYVAVELRQFPDVVLLLFGGGNAGEGDHAVRRIYVGGRGHPANFKPSWMGHSVGSYEGDTLVVDTISLRGERWLDDQGHPHSDDLHLVERIRRVSQNSLEVEVTIDDPKAYKKSWAKKLVRELAAPGPRFWDDSICEELLRMGTHYGAKARQ